MSAQLVASGSVIIFSRSRPGSETYVHVGCVRRLHRLQPVQTVSNLGLRRFLRIGLGGEGFVEPVEHALFEK